MPQPKPVLTGVPLLLAGWLLLALLAGCANEEPAGPSNSKPVIQRVTVQPDSVAPGENVTLTAIALDDDEGDTLTYAWSSFDGAFSGETDQEQVVWTAPGRIGLFDVILTVSDGTDAVLDTIPIAVFNSFSVDITLPLNGAVYTPGDTIVFRGRLLGFEALDINNIDVEWRSDVDSVLNTDSPDTTGLVTFETTLSYDVHQVSLTAILNDTLMATDTVLVNNNQPEPVTLYDVERGYTFNRLTWTRFNDPTRFTAYHITRRLQGSTIDETIALVANDEDTVYVDSSVAIGSTYTYRILAENSFGITAASGSKSIATGVFKAYNDTYIGDMIFAGDSYYLYLSLPDEDQVSVLDVTANNIDYTIDVGDRPFGLAYDGDSNELYVANSADTTLYLIDLSTETISDTIALPRSPLFLDINDFRSQIYITTVGNSYPILVRDDPFAGLIITDIEDSRLIIDSSLVVMDDDRDRLYLTEIGGYPASLYKYDTSTIPPTLLLEDEHNTLGYNLRDLEVMPNGSELLLACISPYRVQMIDPLDFSSTGSLNTGAYPNAVEVGPDGLFAYTANGANTIQVWDLTDSSLLRTLRFANPVARGGIRVSPDGHYLIVATWNRLGNDSTISIIYLP